MRDKKGASGGWIILVIGLVIVLAATGVLNFGGTPTTGNAAGGSSGGSSAGSACQYAPSLSVIAKDKFSSTTIASTAYYKVNGNPAVTTAPSTLNKGVPLEVWFSNATYYTMPKTVTADCGLNQVVLDTWANASATVTVYDNVGKATLNNANNLTLAANGNANLQITYQGTAKSSRMPFGGVFVIEYNNTISSVTCSGSGVSPTTGFHVTYAVSSTGNTYKVFNVDSSLDDGTGLAKTFDCQIKAGASAMPTGSSYILNFIPANYYATNSGDIVLDVEQALNDLTTRTGSGTLSVTRYFA